MAKCASLQHLFESPFPKTNPTLIQPLSSWRNQIKSLPPDASSFADIFDEPHFQDPFNLPRDESHAHKRTESGTSDESSTSSLSTASLGGSSSSGHVEGGVNLQLCTEGLGFESSDVESNENIDDGMKDVDRECVRKNACLENEGQFRNLRKSKSFPPPISSIGGNGRPWVYFISSRHDGRLVLRQFKIPTQVFFNAYREDGSLRLHPVCPVGQPMRTENFQQKNDQVHELNVKAD